MPLPWEGGGSEGGRHTGQAWEHALPTEGWNWDGAGREIFGTERVKTSAGDWMDGVSSAGGVKSISSSKLSSNS